MKVVILIHQIRRKNKLKRGIIILIMLNSNNNRRMEGQYLLREEQFNPINLSNNERKKYPRRF